MTAMVEPSDRWMRKPRKGLSYRRLIRSFTRMRHRIVRTPRPAWEVPAIGGGILGSGLMATAGGLLFYCDGTGAFIAADAKNGKPLWQFNTSQRWKAGPMTYTVDGQQYIGIAAGSTILAFGLW